MTKLTIDPGLAAAGAVDKANAACRRRGGQPSNRGPWPAKEWANTEWTVYSAELVRLYRVFDPALAAAIDAQFKADAASNYTARDKVREEVANDGGESWS